MKTHIKRTKLNTSEYAFQCRNESDIAVVNEIFRERNYKQCDEIIQHAQHAILDIGAHIGVFTAYCRAL